MCVVGMIMWSCFQHVYAWCANLDIIYILYAYMHDMHTQIRAYSIYIYIYIYIYIHIHILHHNAHACIQVSSLRFPLFRTNFHAQSTPDFRGNHDTISRQNSAGELCLRGVGPCYRCNMVNIDPVDATVGNQPLLTLSSYRCIYMRVCMHAYLFV
jgi:hypothetical protein